MTDDLERHEDGAKLDARPSRIRLITRVAPTPVNEDAAPSKVQCARPSKTDQSCANRDKAEHGAPAEIAVIGGLHQGDQEPKADEYNADIPANRCSQFSMAARPDLFIDLARKAHCRPAIQALRRRVGVHGKGIVIQDRRQPAFGCALIPAFAFCIVRDLVAFDAANGEIGAVGMGKVEA